MLKLTEPVQMDPLDLELRSLVAEVAENGPFDDSVDEVNKPKISAIMIVKNEWKTLRRAVESIRPIVSEIIIGVDSETDSPEVFAFDEAFEREPIAADVFFKEFRDNQDWPSMHQIATFLGIPFKELRDRCMERAKEKPTLKVAKECKELIGKGKVFEFDFNNHFSNSRNLTIEKATGDWCLMIDGHEYLENPEVVLRFISEDANPEHLYQVNVNLVELDQVVKHTIYQNRIFRKTPNVHYERGVHNRLIIPEMDEDPEALAPLAIPELVLYHDRLPFLARYRDFQRQQMTKTHMGTDDSPQGLFHCGCASNVRGDYDEALQYFMPYLEKAGDCIESALVCYIVGKIHMVHKGNRKEGVKYFMEGIRRHGEAAFCYLGLAHAKVIEADEVPDKREEFLKSAIGYARVAAGCERPLSTMAVPMVPYTWEPYAVMAELYTRLGEYGPAADCLVNALKFDMDADQKQALEEALVNAQVFSLKELSRLLRPEKNPVLAIYDKTMQFTRDVYDAAVRMGFEVRAYKSFDLRTAYAADVWWVDWNDENALAASNAFKDGRKLIVRCHSYETFGPIPKAIAWENVDVPLYSAPNVKLKLEENFGIDTSRFEELEVFPNKAGFEPFEEDWNPNGDIVILGRFNSKKGMTGIPELAELMPDRTFHVGGTIQDERLYDEVVERCWMKRLDNVVFHGHISEAERGSFLRKGSYYVTLSPWETLSVALSEAMLVKIPCFTLDFEWARYVPYAHKCSSFKEMAEKIYGADENPEVALWRKLGREHVVKQYGFMVEKIERFLDYSTGQRPKDS